MSDSAVISDFKSFEAVKPFGDFNQVIDDSVYHTVEDDWWVGISDVVDSTASIAEGKYKAVNLAGAATICAVSNALHQTQFPFAFGGDGAHFVIPPEHVEKTRNALAETSVWSKRTLGLDLRVALVPVRDVHKSGRVIKIARYASSKTVSYTMFSGGGIGWAEAAIKLGQYAVSPGSVSGEPDLNGLSCQWGTIQSRNGTILSIIVNPNDRSDQSHYSKIMRHLFSVLAKEKRLNPIPEDGPDVRWPSNGMSLQVAVGSARKYLPFVSTITTFFGTALLWLLFKSEFRVGAFIPGKYRREIVANTDFQKYDDGLRMTVDCSTERADEIENLLVQAYKDGIAEYGLHRQGTALLTCIATGLTNGKHVHFLDGAEGGYAQASADLKRHKKVAERIPTTSAKPASKQNHRKPKKNQP
ncbi:MAG: DUF3095 domain-containing protein [Stappiaceae bacterium]